MSNLKVYTLYLYNTYFVSSLKILLSFTHLVMTNGVLLTDLCYNYYAQMEINIYTENNLKLKLNF